MNEIVKPKFEPGQKVWMLINSKAVEREVKSIYICISAEGQSVDYIMASNAEYSDENYKSYAESRLFATKDELKQHVFGD